MSEYQYYEFRAVDRPLTQKQMKELRRYSSRAEITQSGFVNVYNYGDFSGDPDRLMETYFDAFVYLANWGSRWFMLRIPSKMLGIKAVKAYCVDEYLSCHQKGSNVILSFRYEDEEGYEWVEGEGWLASLLPIRADLLRGDMRALYIAWLLTVQSEEVDAGTREPPVPPGLDNLTTALNQFAKFLCVDKNLIAAAAEQNADFRDEPLSGKKLDSWLSTLPTKERNTLLAKFIMDDDPHLWLANS